MKIKRLNKYLAAFLMTAMILPNFAPISFASTTDNSDLSNLKETDNIAAVNGIIPDKIINDFNDAKDVSVWKPMDKNIQSIASVSSILNDPKTTYDGTNCMEVTPLSTVKNYTWRNVYRDFSNAPLDLSEYNYLSFNFNCWGGLNTGYYLEVDLYNQDDVYKASKFVTPNMWSSYMIDISDWTKKNNITKIEFHFVNNMDLQKGQPGYDCWNGNFQIDNLGAEKNMPSSKDTSSKTYRLGYDSKNIIDKNIYSYYSSKLYDNADESEWVALNFGYMKYNIQNTVFYLRKGSNGYYGFPSNFKLQYTKDNINWTDIPGQSYTNYVPSNQLVTFKFENPIDAVSIRLYATKLNKDESGKYCMQLCEFKTNQKYSESNVFEINDINVSSTLNGYNKMSLADNSNTTGWSSNISNDSNTNEYIIIDLGKSFNVNKLELIPADGNKCFPKNFEILSSTDGKTYNQIDGQEYKDYKPQPVSQDAHAEVININFKSTVLARYIKINASQLNSDENGKYSFKLNEVRVINKAPFSTDKQDNFDLYLNEMWNEFGAVNDGTNAVYLFGNEPTYYDWMATKILWSNDEQYKKDLKSRIRDIAMSSDGYLWSWNDNPEWPSGSALHFGNNVNFISSVYQVVSWENSKEFLNEIDQTYSGSSDVSKGMTVGEKVDKAMQYVLNDLSGKDGLMVINNGQNTGEIGGKASNYWDNLQFGYKDVYSNIYFYKSLLSMSGIEKMRGNNDKSDYYKNLAVKAKQVFNQEFWDASKGRYIGNIDDKGNKMDLGFTFVNVEAVANGLADSSQAKSIFDWLDGNRIIKGENSTGSDIYSFGFAPRSNTIAVETTKSPYWWNSLDGAISVDSNAAYGQHLENGGAILYTSYFDVLARSKYLSADNAENRLNKILQEYSIDELRRNPVNNCGAAWVLGTIGAFPESGLVPVSFVSAFAGLNATSEGLEINPDIPSDMNSISVKDVTYGKSVFDINIKKNNENSISDLLIDNIKGQNQAVNLVLNKLIPGKHYVLALKNNNTTVNFDFSSDSNGKASICFSPLNISSAEIKYSDEAINVDDQNKTASEYVTNAEKTNSEIDYKIAKSLVDNLQDENSKNALSERLSAVYKKIEELSNTVTNMTLSSSDVSINTKQTFNIAAAVTMGNGDTKNLHYESDGVIYSGYDTNIVNVKDGLITPIGVGKTSITVTYKNMSSKLNVTVTEAPLEFKAAASSQLSDTQWAAQNVCDKDADTVWSSNAHASESGEEWLYVDTSRNNYISGVTVTARVDGLGFPVDFKFQCSNDGKTWKDIDGMSFKGYRAVKSHEQITFNFPSIINTRYIRMYATKFRGDGYFCQIADFIPTVVNSKTITAIEKVEVNTNVGVSPKLPSKITVTYLDNSKGEADVVWDNIDEAKYKTAGTFEVYGTVNGTAIKAVANITVNKSSDPEPTKPTGNEPENSNAGKSQTTNSQTENKQQTSEQPTKQTVDTVQNKKMPKTGSFMDRGILSLIGLVLILTGDAVLVLKKK